MKQIRRLHMLYTGTHTPKSGRKVEMTKEFLAETAESYDMSRHRAPIAVNDANTAIMLGAPAVLGHIHPDELAKGGALPAFGRVLRTYTDDSGENLYGDVEVTDKMAEMLDEGMYDKVSVSLYGRNDPANPTPGKTHLRHLGFHGSTGVSLKELESLPPSTDYAENLLSFAEIVESDEFEFNNHYTESQTMDKPRGYDEIMGALIEGSKGFKGEITELMPNKGKSDFWNEEKQQFEGQFIGDEDIFNFTIERKKDGSYVRTYDPANLDDFAELDDDSEGCELYTEETVVETVVAIDDSVSIALSEAIARAEAAEAKLQMIETQAHIESVATELTSFCEAVGVDSKELASALVKGEAINFGEAENSVIVSAFVTAGELLKTATFRVATSEGELDLGENFACKSKYDYNESMYGGMSVDKDAYAVHQKACEYCDDNNLDKNNPKDYMKAIKAIM